jgi:hypothetical protein
VGRIPILGYLLIVCKFLKGLLKCIISTKKGIFIGIGKWKRSVVQHIIKEKDAP